MLTFEAMNAIAHELQRAREKFPQQDIWRTLAALTEEVGELNQAVLKNTGEGKTKTREDIEGEAVQVAVMAIRVACDCS